MQLRELYPGLGLPLRKGASATDGRAFSPETEVIANGEYSESFAGHGCQQFAVFCRTISADATGDILIENSDSGSFANNGDTWKTETLTAERAASILSGGAAPGYYRIRNTCGQSINVFLQKYV